MLGLYQEDEVVGEEVSEGLGGWPMIPPSRMRMLVWDENTEAIIWAVEGEVALRSRK